MKPDPTLLDVVLELRRVTRWLRVVVGLLLVVLTILLYAALLVTP